VHVARSLLFALLFALVPGSGGMPGTLANGASGAEAPAASQDPAGARFVLGPAETLLVLGNTFAERIAQSGYLEALVHAAHPGAEITVRTVAWSADEVGLRPRETSVPSIEDHVDRLDPGVILACYGMSESFRADAGLADFERDLGVFLDRIGTRPDGSARRIVLVSPIAHEDLGSPWPTGSRIVRRNEVLRAFAEILRAAASARGLRHVDLLSFTARWTGEPLTTNGIHPSERGAQVLVHEIGRRLGWLADARVSIEPEAIAAAERLRLLACDAHYHFRSWYRPTNTEYVFGRRAEPYGVVNFPPERAQLLRMVEARERRMRDVEVDPAALFARAPGTTPRWETLPAASIRLPEDRWDPEPVEAKGTETSLGDLDIDDPESFAESFTLAAGYRIECFASERDFAELENPMALAFDARGRLWVLCMPTYPHLLPGDHPRGKLLILEDRDGDGRADRRTVFADRLYVPTGFAIDTDAVYVGQAPDLLRLRDSDGDDVADSREIVLSGFAMPDSHHQLSAFEWMPGGGFVLHEGVFSRTNVETPYGTRRARDAAVWHFDPRTERLTALSHCGFANPWGHAFDDFGQSVLADASGGDNFSFSHVIHAFDYPRKPGRPGPILNRGRPTAGCELIASRHFPEDVQETFLVNQSIGFHGTRWDRLLPEGSSWRSERLPEDLLACSDQNFRPVALEIGPDGALYVVDWCNPIVGHMQYSVRDPRRDHSHGRIWRVRHAERPLLEPPRFHDASIPELLELLRLPERNTRQLARCRLQTLPADRVLPVVTAWTGALDPSDPLRDRLLLEGLWIHQAHGRFDLGLAGRVLRLYEPRARAGAVRVLRHGLQTEELGAEAASLLELAAADPDMRVRLETVVACGFLPRAAGVAIASRAAEHPMDAAMRTVLRETLVHLAPGAEAGSPAVRRLVLETLPAKELLERERDAVVASVILARDDVPLGTRGEALAGLAGDDPEAQARRLLEEIDRAPTARGVRALGALLLARAPGSGALAGELAARLDHGTRAVRIVARAALLRRAAPPSRALGGDAAELVESLAMLDPGDAPPAAVASVRAAVERAAVEPAPAVEQVVRHAADREAAYGWLAGMVDAVERRSLARFGGAHVRAMAALRGLHLAGADAWPGAGRYRLSRVAPERLERGRALYEDEKVGCARCHAADGRGIEGFPPLRHAPWLLGDPERAASIVVHGLFGELSMPDGARFASAMAPLGASLDDRQVADVLTYARRSFGNFAPAVSPRHVRRARETPPERGGLWEASALARRYPLERDGLLRALPAPVVTGAAAGPAPPVGPAMTSSMVMISATVAGLATVVAIVVFLSVLNRNASSPSSSRGRENAP